MTESEWLACTDTWKMLEFLGEKASDRKRRLFACACCRRVWHLLADERSKFAVEVIERYAEGLASAAHLSGARHAANAADFAALTGARSIYFAACAVSHAVAADAADTYRAAYITHTDTDDLQSEPQVPLLRDIFGNPFRPLTISPALLTWNDAVVVRLAQAAYEERHLPTGTLDSSRLAILADALEEAGCTDADILDHLRGPGPHVRGCWPVDLCLGKT